MISAAFAVASPSHAAARSADRSGASDGGPFASALAIAERGASPAEATASTTSSNNDEVATEREFEAEPADEEQAQLSQTWTDLAAAADIAARLASPTPAAAATSTAPAAPSDAEPMTSHGGDELAPSSAAASEQAVAASESNVNLGIAGAVDTLQRGAEASGLAASVARGDAPQAQQTRPQAASRVAPADDADDGVKPVADQDPAPAAHGAARNWDARHAATVNPSRPASSAATTAPSAATAAPSSPTAATLPSAVLAVAKSAAAPKSEVPTPLGNADVRAATADDEAPGADSNPATVLASVGPTLATGAATASRGRERSDSNGGAETTSPRSVALGRPGAAPVAEAIESRGRSETVATPLATNGFATLMAHPDAAAHSAPTRNTASPAPLQASFEAPLSASLNSPEFAPALGVQLSTLVRNGIPEARLHLNPAELGPIAVQIELDGRNAQVVMSAAHADTRQALEQAMPHLVQTLSDAGFTMSGGGVFQQPQSRPDSGPAMTPAQRARRDAEVVADGLGGALPQASTARVQRGVVDLYA
jgi:flagellar hook-length control protein FliK